VIFGELKREHNSTMAAKKRGTDGAGADAAIGVSAADADFIKQKGLSRFATLSNVEHARQKSSDTGAKEPAPTFGLWVRLEDEDGTWRPRPSLGEECVSNKMGTGIREPFVNVSDIAAVSDVRRVDVELHDGVITVRDDGLGIPVEKNGDGQWIPYACFFVFKSGSNVERASGTVMGGTNGLGVKLTSALSEWVTVKSVHGAKAFEGGFRGGMENVDHDACVVRSRQKGEKTGVEFSFKLREEYFSSLKLTPQLVKSVRMQQQLFVETLSAHMAAYLGPRKVQVWYNGARVGVSCMADLVRPLAAGEDGDGDASAGASAGASAKTLVAVKVPVEAGRAGGGWFPAMEWEVVALLGVEGGREHASLVNGTPTYKGPHITAALTAIRHATAAAAAKKKELAGLECDLTPAQIGAHVKLIISARVPDADWNDQAKTQLQTPNRYALTLPPRFLKPVTDWLVTEALMPKLATKKVSTEVRAKVDTRLSKKHVPAYFARSPRPAEWQKNVLFIMEGTSAKHTTVRVFISTKGAAKKSWMCTDHLGFIEAGGVLMNAQRETARTDADDLVQSARMLNNVPSQAFLQLLRERRYGHVVFATDADIDGWMIMSQALCFYLSVAPEIFESCRDLPHLYFWQTPVGRTYLGSGEKRRVTEYYTRAELAEKAKTAKGATEYFKGLGSLDIPSDHLLITAADERIIPFGIGADPDADRAREALRGAAELWFGKDADARKAAIARGPSPAAVAAVERVLAAPLRAPGGRGAPETHRMGPSHPRLSAAGRMPAAEFIETTMQEVARDKNQRSLKALDGLYEGTRKAVLSLITCAQPDVFLQVFIRGGDLTAKGGYAHGNASGEGILMGMGALGLGLGTMPFVRLSGQGPARESGVASAASARYVFSKVNMRLLEAVFRPKETAPFLRWKEAWGERWEPERYMPVVPYAVMDYAAGIGLGWNQRIMARDPVAAATAVKQMILQATAETAPRCARLPPDTHGFRGRWRRAREGEVEVERFSADWTYDAKKEELTTQDLPYWDNAGPILFDAAKKKAAAAVARNEGRGWELRANDCVANNPTLVVRIPRADMAPGGFVAEQGGAAALFRLEVDHVVGGPGAGVNVVDFAVAGGVKRYPSYEAVVEAWFEETRDLYEKRREREIAVLTAQLALALAEDRYCRLESELGLDSTKSEAEMEKILEEHRFAKMNVDFIRNPSATDPAAILAGATGAGSTYRHLLGMSKLDISASRAGKRREKIARLRADLAAERRDTAPIPGAGRWLREIDEFLEVFAQGRATKFAYEDA